jgi:glycosyltransferase involved in cell wall biosynthesis
MIVVIMGQNAMDFLPMCLDSVRKAKTIIYLDGGSSDGSLEFAKNFQDNVITLTCEYSQTDPEQNSKSRNFYLNYLKEEHLNEWILVIDADEVVQDLDNLLEDEKHLEADLFSVKMRHLMYSLVWEDNTRDKHFVPNRLFKITSDLYYPKGEHCPLTSNSKVKTSTYSGVTIWHLAMANMMHVKKRYVKNLKHSSMHSKEFLEMWYRHIIFGSYPVKNINVSDLPKEILDFYLIDKDEIYFSNRTLEVKHFLECLQWKDYFKPQKVLDVGCGLGPRVFVFNQYGIDCTGFEISKWAVDHSLFPNNVYWDNLENIKMEGVTYDLVIAYDVLEHLDNLELGIANLKKLCSKNLLISVPVVGDPNLEKDNSHKQFLQKFEWIEKICKAGFKLKETPDYFMYEQQIMIFEVV